MRQKYQSTIAVIGGFSFLGSHLAERLLTTTSHSLRIFDKASAVQIRHRSALAHRVESRDRLQFSECDPERLSPSDLKLGQGESLSFVFYIASLGHDSSLTSSSLEAALNWADQEGARLVLVTTNPLALSVRQILEAQLHTHNLKFRKSHGALRCVNPYGPRMNSSDANGLVRVLTQSLLGEASSTLENQDFQPRSLCYVKDAVDGIIKYARDPRLTEPQTLCGPRMHGLAEILSVTSDLLSESPMSSPAAPAQTHELSAYKTTRDLLNWEARVDLRTGMAKVLHWMRSEMPSTFARPRRAAEPRKSAVSLASTSSAAGRLH